MGRTGLGGGGMGWRSGQGVRGIEAGLRAISVAVVPLVSYTFPSLSACPWVHFSYIGFE